MPSLSPRTQQMQMGAGAGADQATAAFEKGFSDMAYSVIMNRFPDMVQDIVTFKVLDTDLDTGMGVGAFVVLRKGQPLYIPVVMNDNAIKPIELIYHKSLNIFMPLTKGWLGEIDKAASGTLGQGIKTPESLYTDVDIRNVMVPPMTGRFSYAELIQGTSALMDLEALEKSAAEPAPMLLDFLERAPNSVKTAFAKVLERQPKLLKHAASIYGVSALSSALQMRAEKIAAKQTYGGALWIADKDTTPVEFKRIFGDQAAEAYAGVRRKGYAAKDERMTRNLAVQEQPYARWVEPRQPGVYILHKSDSTDAPAFVMPNPIDLLNKGTRYGRRPAVGGHNPLLDNSYYDPTPYQDPIRVYPQGRPDESEFALGKPGREFLAVLPNGDYLETDRLAGRDSVADSLGGSVGKKIFGDLAGEPRKGLGFWIRTKGTTMQATSPVEIKSVMTDSEGVRRVKISSPGGWSEEKEVITQATHPYGTIWMPKGANIVYLPPDFIWVPLKTKLKQSDFFTSALDIQACVSSALAAVGVRKSSIKNAGMGQFSLDGGAPMDHVPALRKLASDCVLPVEDAEALLVKAAAERRVEFWVASPEKLAQAQMLVEKRSADEAPAKKKKAPAADPAMEEGADPSMDPSMDPAMAGMDPSMMGQPPAPPPPTPTDMAAMEMQQHIDAEMQKLQEKSEMLMALTQRANEISGGAPPMPTVQSQAMGAPPPSQNLATGMPAPPQGGMPGPSMMGQPQGQPAQPGMDPSMMGAAPGSALPMAPQGGQPGMDPSMMGQDPSMMGQDPSMMGQPQQPPMAMMGPDGPSTNGFGQEVNPQFLQQASQLPGDMFDAAAVASLAQSPAVKEIVGQYLPNLEKAVDNLGRVLLSLEMQEPTLKQEVGEAAFTDLEETLRSTFRSMGDLVLKLSQSAHSIEGQYGHASA